MTKGGRWFRVVKLAAAVMWLVGMSGLLAMPFFKLSVRLDENALLPLLSDPTPAHSSELRIREDHKPTWKEPAGVQKILGDRGLPSSSSSSSPSSWSDFASNSSSGSPCEITSTLLRAKSNPQKQNMLWFVDSEMLPVSLDLMLLLKESRWLSRDMIFVHVSKSESCEPSATLNAWLEAYHYSGSSDPSWRPESVVPVEGNIAAAVVLSSDKSGESGADLMMSINSGTGILPNLDLVTTFRVIQESLGSLSLALKGMESCEDGRGQCKAPESLEAYWRSFSCLATFYRRHWMASATDHPEFRKYNVDAIEVSFNEPISRDIKVEKQRDLVKTLELFARALNNVEEKLHHSTYTYMLFGTGCGVSTPFAWIWFVVLLQVTVLVTPLADLHHNAPTAHSLAVDTAAIGFVCFTCLQLFQDPLRVYTLCALVFPLTNLLLWAGADESTGKAKES
ncbi:hypothetical protein HOP50_15g75070 [Chloropicon primus]|nr:hypothetical protein A3770_15p74820 [Chloropicon primus]UPR04173.1 hypothetical protein HOP50_15g75070 [Chloropicon primus]|eukprot:QDZ24964.1 hypothetical protein A3770_15p74820 [Chloropicon primus]